MINQKKIELEISGVLERGDIADIADESGIGYSYLESQLNPNDPRMSHIVGALKTICAYRKVSPGRALKVWQIMEREWNLAAPVIELNLCAKHETGMLSKEVSEFVAAKLDGLSFNKQMDELLDIERQLKQTKYALINEQHRQNSVTPNVRRMKVKP